MIDLYKQYDNCKDYIYDLLGMSEKSEKGRILFSKVYRYIQFVPIAPELRIADEYLAQAIRNGEEIPNGHDMALRLYRANDLDQHYDFVAEDFLGYCENIKEIALGSADFSWMDLAIRSCLDMAWVEERKWDESFEEHNEVEGDDTGNQSTVVVNMSSLYEPEGEDEEDELAFDNNDDASVMRYFEENPWETTYVDSDGYTWDNPFYDDDY